VTESTPDRRPHWTSLAVPPVVALGVRLAWWLETRATDPLYGRYILDADYYDAMARRILAAGPLLDRPFQLAPLYGYFLAGIYPIFGDGPDPVMVLQALLAAASTFFACRIGARLAGVRQRPSLGAWVAGLATALHPLAIFYDARLLSVGLSTFLTTAAAWLLMEVWDRKKHFLLAGLVLGLAITARANLLLVAPFLFFACAFRVLWGEEAARPGSGRRLRWRSLAQLFVFGLGMALPVALSTAHNFAAGGGFAPVAANGGLNLYMGNNEKVDEYAALPFHLPASLADFSQKSVLVASIEAGRDLTPAEADAFWRSLAVANWEEDPVRQVGLFFRKTAQTLGFREYYDNAWVPSYTESSVVLRYLPDSWGVLAILAVLGLAVRRRAHDLPLLLLLVGGVASIALFFVVDRYRLPLLPLVSAYAGLFLAWAFDALRGKRWIALSVSACAGGLLFLLLWPVATRPWLPWNWLAEAGSSSSDPCAARRHVSYAPADEDLFQKGAWQLLQHDKASAAATFQELVGRSPGDAAGWTALAWMLLEDGRNQEALPLCEKAVSIDACDDKAWSNLGTAQLRLGSWQDAADALQRAITLEPHEPEYWSTYGEAWLHLGQLDKAHYWLSRAARWAPYAWQPRVALAQLAFKEADYTEAKHQLTDALAIVPRRGDLWAMLGTVQIALGDPAEAAAILKRTRDAGIRDPALDELASAMLRHLRPQQDQGPAGEGSQQGP
jgi:Flp pilus assembly protein TadD/4-amino-4-deoxy-L-arabinose transferase-like glycosyltransferase